METDLPLLAILSNIATASKYIFRIILLHSSLNKTFEPGSILRALRIAFGIMTCLLNLLSFPLESISHHD